MDRHQSINQSINQNILEEIFILNSEFKSTFDRMWIQIILLAELRDFPASDFPRSLANGSFFGLYEGIDEKITKMKVCKWISTFILPMI